MSASDSRLLPCPFCGSGETQIQPTLYWTGMRNNVISVTIRHWCKPLGELDGTLLQVKGKTEEEAIASWNRRTPAPALDPSTICGAIVSGQLCHLPIDHDGECKP